MSENFYQTTRPHISSTKYVGSWISDALSKLLELLFYYKFIEEEIRALYCTAHKIWLEWCRAAFQPEMCEDVSVKNQ